MKKRFNLLLATIISILSSLIIVSAQEGFSFERGFSQIGQWIEYVGSALFTGGYLFEKILFFFLLIILIYVILSRIPLFADNTVVIWIVSLIISLLATRYLTNTQLVLAILLPYNVLGVGILAMIPLVIFFYFIETSIESSLIRKIGWALFAVTYFILAYLQVDKLDNLIWIYIGTAILGLIFIALDKQIRAMFIISALRRGGLDDEKVRQMIKLQEQINRDTELIASTNSAGYRERLMKSVARNKKKLKDLAKL